jgi:hypothetical protein
VSRVPAIAATDSNIDQHKHDLTTSAFAAFFNTMQCLSLFAMLAVHVVLFEYVLFYLSPGHV